MTGAILIALTCAAIDAAIVAWAYTLDWGGDSRTSSLSATERKRTGCF